MTHKFRIFGGELGEARGYLDVEVSGVVRGGSVVLRDVDSGDEYSMELEKIEKLQDESLAYDFEYVDEGKEVWSAIDNLEQSYVDSTEDEKSHYIDAARTLFRGA